MNQITPPLRACLTARQGGRVGFFIIIFFLFTLVPLGKLLFSQSQFQVMVGGSKQDYANCIIQTTDGGYVAAGATKSFGTGNKNFYIVKLNGSGSLQWTRTVGGSNSDIAYSIVQTRDGGYAVTGWSESFGLRMYIVKLDSSGGSQWNKSIGATYQDRSYSIIQTTDGGYAVAGSTIAFLSAPVNFYIVKLDSTGSLQWSRAVGETNDDEAHSIVQTKDGGYAVAGETFSIGSGHTDFYIVKLDINGTLQWSRIVGSTGDASANSIIQTTEGGFAIAGYYDQYGYGGGDFYIVKLDSNGLLQWTRTVGGGGDNAYSIIQTSDGGYAVAGYTYSFGAVNGDMYIVKLNGNGILQWSKIGDITASSGAQSIIKTIEGGYALGGEISFYPNVLDSMKVYIVKFDSNWNTCGTTIIPNPQTSSVGKMNTPPTIVSTPPTTVNTPTPVISSGGTETYLCLTGITNHQNQTPSEFKLYQNYPNPFNPTTKIKFDIPPHPLTKGAGVIDHVTLKIYDILGREIATLINEKLKPGTYEVTWDGSKYASGVYFYQLKSKEFIQTKKMVLLR